jgi:Flp pilus assembly pilin Flp
MAARPDLTLARDVRGATVVEYAVIAGVLSLAIFGIIGQAQSALLTTLTKAATAVEAAIQ